MDRRGQFEVLQLSFFFEILIAIAVAALLVYSSVSFDVFSKFKHEYARADLTLLMDQVVSAPGAVEVTYPLSDRYKITMADGSVDVKTESTILPSKNSYLLLSKDTAGSLDVRRVQG